MKRGVIYLASAILIAAVMLTIFFTRATPSEKETSESIFFRISTMARFIDDFHQDIDRATFISGFRAFIALEERINQQGDYLTDPDSDFTQAFLNGTIAGDSYDIMINSTFNQYLDRVRAQSSKIGIDLNVTIINITLNQSGPWAVDIELLARVNITDMQGLANWNYEKSFVTEVSILDLRDPLYTVETQNRIRNTIRRSIYNYSQFITLNDTTILNNELIEMYYRSDPHAPSYLYRLQGRFNESPNGISSLVNLDELNNQGVTVDLTRSIIDYIYFDTISTTQYCPTEGEPLPTWFKLDATHYNDPKRNYELPELEPEVC